MVNAFGDRGGRAENAVFLSYVLMGSYVEFPQKMRPWLAPIRLIPGSFPLSRDYSL
jgi:hypothetical protein